MIYLLYGNDTEKARAKLHALVESMLAKKPDASHVRLTDETWNSLNLDELAVSSGLFAKKMIIEVDRVFKNKEAKEQIFEKIKDIAASENIFVFLEGALDKKTLEKFEKHAEKVQEFGAAREKSGRRDFLMGEEGRPLKNFNLFALTDAFGRRDKKQAWVVYAQALKREVPPEEIHGLLSWQVKAMLLSRVSKDAKEAGLNPFVYQKSLSFSKNFSDEELKNISSRLVSMYHNAHRGREDFDVSLEKFLLEM